MGARVATESPRPARVAAPIGSGAGKLAKDVARAIEDEIIEAGWPVGTYFASEAELLERYPVSRSVLREALLLVEHHQVAQRRRGTGGGLIVRAPDPSAITDALAVYFRRIGITLEELVDARQVVESLALQLATDRTDLGRPVDDGDLHLWLGRASGNEAVQLFVDVLSRLTHQMYAPAARADAEVMRHSAEAHEGIVVAVTAGEAATALALLTKHLVDLQDAADRGLAVPATHRVDELAGTPGVKLAQVLAERIQEQIIGERLPAGTVLGSEADLCRTYGVGRDVFREAVLLLNQHSVAVMKRGPGGGLVVSEPDVSALTEAVALYLSYEQIDQEAVSLVRGVLELACIERAVRQMSDSSAQRLLQCLAAEARTPDDSISEVVHDLHVLIGDLSGSRVLSAFVHVLTQLTLHHHVNRSAVPETAAGVRDAHRAIVSAMVIGDLDLARRRMLRHLQALSPWLR